MAEERQAAGDEGEEITLIEDEPVANADQTQEVETRPEGDARTGHRETVGDEGTGEVAADHQITVAETTARQRRRQRERERMATERQELMVLRRENESLKKNQVQIDTRVSHIEVSAVDTQIGSLENEIARAGSVMARAMVDKDAESWQQAQEIRDKFRDRLVMLREQKKALATRPVAETSGDAPVARTEAGRPGKAPTFSQAQIEYARTFTQRHAWYKTDGSDADSAEVMRIDQDLAHEGMNPSTPEYWWELEKRIAEEMPHHTPPATIPPKEAPKPNGGRPRGPKLPGSGGGGNGANGGGPRTFHLSAARRQSLVDLGVWDDPAARMKYVKRFMQWDKDNAAESSRKN